MTKLDTFFIIEAVLAISIAFAFFRTPKFFFKCLKSFLYSGFYVLRKELEGEPLERRYRFWKFIIVFFVASILNLLTLEYFINDKFFPIII
jgi:hypothetical protein